MLNRPLNILVTGVGAIIGYGIINSLKQSGHSVRIIGMDIYDDAYGQYIADDFIKAELASSANYIPFINGVIEKFSIDLIIPGIEQDLYALHKNKHLISTKAKVVFNNDECISLSKSKLETFRYFEGKGINRIPTLYKASFSECVNKLSLPFLIKPISGYASKGISAINNEAEFLFYTNKLNNNCIYQKIIGTIDSEYTISVFGNGKGDFFDSIILKRKLSQEGATSKAILIENAPGLLQYVTQVCQLLKPVGPTNIQLRVENEVPYLLEINPRISSACSIRTHIGYNEPAMCINYFLLGKDPVAQPKKRAQVIRYISDHVVYE